MTPECQPEIFEIIESKKDSFPNAEIIVEGELTLLDRQNDFQIVLSELLNNCLENEGVTTVKFLVEERRLVAEDDVVHDDAEEIAARLNKEEVETAKEGHLGSGIWGARLLLRKHNGELKFFAKEGRIIAEATWSK